MAGLLEIIARRLLSGNEPKKAGRTVTRTVPRTTYKSASSAASRKTSNTTASDETVLSSMNEAVDDEFTDTATAGEWVIDRTIKRERTNRELGREDYLLNQIDEFREKAQQLQELLLSKESKVAELQNIVDEREGKARALEGILTERQRKADDITEEMTKQIDSLIDRVSAKMDEIGVSISSSVNSSVSSIGRGLEDNYQLSEKQIQELQELKELLATITPQLEGVKVELSDKVHTENVKCYRNISDLFKSMEDKMDKIDEVQQGITSVRKCTVTLIVFTVINLLGIVALALYELGVFQLLLG